MHQHAKFHVSRAYGPYKVFLLKGSKVKVKVKVTQTLTMLLHIIQNLEAVGLFSSGDMLRTRFKQDFSIIGVKGQGHGQCDITLVHDTPSR